MRAPTRRLDSESAAQQDGGTVVGQLRETNMCVEREGTVIERIHAEVHPADAPPLHLLAEQFDEAPAEPLALQAGH